MALVSSTSGCSKSTTSPSSNTAPAKPTFTATLLPANEVPPVSNAEASGQGTATVVFDVTKDSAGNITEVHCTYDPETRGGNAPDGRKVKSTIHWVSAQHAVDAEVRLYDNLFTKEDPSEVEDGQDFTANLNPNSLGVIKGAKIEPSLKDAPPLNRYQFERLGYFCVDQDSDRGRLVFNRTATLRDTWAKIEKRSS